MTIIKLIKTHLPFIASKDRAAYAKKIESVSNETKKPVLDVILEVASSYESEMDRRKQRDSIPMMDKIIVTGLLIETNDRLEGTLFDRYYCRITDNVGKRFMNAQYKIYQKEYNDLLTSRFNDVSFLTENLNRGVKILSKAMRTDTVETFEIIEEMQSDPVLQKRISGIYKKHKKQSNAKTRNDEQN